MSSRFLRLRVPFRRSFCSQSKQNVKPPREFTPRSSQLYSSYKQAASTPAPDISMTQKFNLFIESLYKTYQHSSFMSKLFYGSMISLILFGDYLDRQFLEYHDPNGIYSLLQDSPEDQLMNVSKTGDVMVFQRPILSFNPLNMLRTSFRQFICGGPYDHCGVVISNKHDDNFPYIIEIDQNYRNKIRITPFDERILTAREQAIFIRQVQRINVANDICMKLSDWIDYKMNNEEGHNQQNIDEVEQFFSSIPHKRDPMISVLLTMFFNGDNTVKLRSAIRDLTRKIKQNEYEIKTQINERIETQGHHGTLQTVKQNQRHGRIKNTDELISETRIFKIQRQLKRDYLVKRSKKIRKSRKINSAEFVGNCWIYMGLLDQINGPKPSEIRPQQFADSKIEIIIPEPGRLGHVQFVKTANEGKKINDVQKRYRTTRASEL